MKETSAKFGANAVRQQVQIPQLADFLTPLAVPKPQPSLRVPVTRANRRLLRALRAAEEVAWEKGIIVSRNRRGVQ